MFNLRLLSLLLAVSAVQAANLRGLQACPAEMPSGTCTSADLQCGYDYIQVPRLHETVCTAQMDCLPSTMCSCVDDTWQCMPSGDVTECKNGAPKGAFEPCNP